MPPRIEIEMSSLEFFFGVMCGTDGSVPDCSVCEHNIGNSGCAHPLNPNNASEE